MLRYDYYVRLTTPSREIGFPFSHLGFSFYLGSDRHRRPADIAVLRQVSEGASAQSADVVIIGAGAAGMMCAIEAGKRGRSVLLIDHAARLGEKIRISGGGRCNFTNIDVRPEHYLSENPDFCRSALARYTPRDFIALIEKHGIAWHERKHGQLFCDDSAQQIIEMLKTECDDARVRWCMPAKVSSIEKRERFLIATHRGTFESASLVIASGGLSIPQIGASPFG